MTKIQRVLSKSGRAAVSPATMAVNREYNWIKLEGWRRFNATTVCGVLVDVTLVPKYASVQDRRELWRSRVHPKRKNHVTPR